MKLNISKNLNENTMKISNQELTTSFKDALGILANTKISKSKIQYALLKTIGITDAAIKDYTEARKAVLENAAKKGEDGKPLIKEIEQEGENGKKEKVSEYVFEGEEVKENAIKELQELYKMEIDLSIHSVDISEFEGIEIEPIVLLNLKDFIQ